MTSVSESAILCPVCHALESTLLLEPPQDYEYSTAIAPEFGVRVCSVCSSEFVWPRPTVAELRQMYPDTYYAYDQEMSRFWQSLYALRCKGEAKRLLQLSTRRPLRLFDVGVGDRDSVGV